LSRSQVKALHRLFRNMSKPQANTISNENKRTNKVL
jgi:hypothetical protein